MSMILFKSLGFVGQATLRTKFFMLYFETFLVQVHNRLTIECQCLLIGELNRSTGREITHQLLQLILFLNTLVFRSLCSSDIPNL